MLGKTRVLVGISFLSAQILATEVILTRFFSISQGYHYAFLVVSIAFLGFGAGSVLLFLSGHLSQAREPETLLSRLALFLSLSVILSFFLINHLTFNPVELLWDQAKIGLIPVHFLILSLPFFLGGLSLSSALTLFPTVVHQVYFADLTGAGLGIVLSALSFRLAGDRGAVWLLVLIALAASWLFLNWKKSSRANKYIQVVASLAVFLFIIFSADSLIFKISDYKPLSFFLKQKGAKTTQVLWDEKVRLDLFVSPAIRYAPGLSLRFSGQIPEQIGLSLDAERTSGLINLPVAQESLLFLDYLPVSIAFKKNQGGNILLLKPESDLELFLSLRNRAKQVTIFEENEPLRKLHKKQYVSWSEVTKQEATKVNFKTVEARVGLSQDKQKNKLYDLIVYPLPDLPGSFSTGFFGPQEDYLMTEEAAATIFNLLDRDGLIAALFYFLPPPRQELRFLALWVETLERLGCKPDYHILYLRSVETIAFFIKKSPFSEEEIKEWAGFSSENFYDLGILGPQRTLSPTPFIHSDFSTWETLASNLLANNLRQNLYRDYLFEVRPPVDDKPFFYDFLKWSRWNQIFNFFNQRLYPLFLGKFLVAFLFLQALIIGFILILLPLITSSPRRLSSVRKKPLFFGYFASLGFGYMLVEITLFHKFILLLGHPTFSLSAVLFFLLSTSGAGSLTLIKLEKKIGKSRLGFWPLICMGIIVAQITILKVAQPLILTLSLPFRLAASFLIILPLGFCLGIPFPFGLRHFYPQSEKTTPFAFAANSFFSLLASVLALWQALIFGYKSVFILSAVTYFLSFAFFYLANHRHKPNIQ